ncbi:hypothetical protein KM043_013632 [Ampulex compressa]|nr:hypothetical protein KM043_013632 [Ampulex compressa]
MTVWLALSAAETAYARTTLHSQAVLAYSKGDNGEDDCGGKMTCALASPSPSREMPRDRRGMNDDTGKGAGCIGGGVSQAILGKGACGGVWEGEEEEEEEEAEVKLAGVISGFHPPVELRFDARVVNKPDRPHEHTKRTHEEGEEGEQLCTKRPGKLSAFRRRLWMCLKEVWSMCFSEERENRLVFDSCRVKVDFEIGVTLVAGKSREEAKFLKFDFNGGDPISE